MCIPSSLDPRYLTTVQQLANRYSWSLLDHKTWAKQAYERTGACVDDQAVYSACLVCYAEAVYAACQQPDQQEKAYRELHSYLWAKANRYDPDLANDAAQEALVLIYRSFQANDLTPCRQPSAFLFFAHYKLKDAFKLLRRVHSVDAETPASYLADAESGQDPVARAVDPAPSPMQQMLAQEETAWLTTLEQQVVVQVLTCLGHLWQSRRRRRQVRAMLLTFMDQATDAAVNDEQVAARLSTSKANVEVLRSRGLGKLRQCLSGTLLVEETTSEVEKGAIS